jgi:hypothetical protein
MPDQLGYTLGARNRGNNTTFSDFLSAAMERDVPQLFFGSVAQQARNPAERRYLSGQFEDFINQLQGAWGQQMLSGQYPSLTAREFIGQMPLSQRFPMSPSMIGRGTRRFATVTRWLTSY